MVADVRTGDGSEYFMKVSSYAHEHAPAWNAFVAKSKNGTFLFDRDYMDYHRDRFEDASLMIYDDADELVAIFPANRKDGAIVSHGGLTYGGIVTGPEMRTIKFLDVFVSLIGHLKESGFTSLEYKVVPSIYHSFPSDEDKYCLFLLGAELIRRDVSVVILSGKRLPLTTQRKRHLNKAVRAGLRVEESGCWGEFWEVLGGNLDAKYKVRPVHSLDEIQLLRSRFPNNIRLFMVFSGTQAVAGTVIYETPQVAHAQYIGSNENGREHGALDMLFSHLLDDAFADKPYFNFGISTTSNGYSLNKGLLDFKESFGARCVVQDCYRVDLRSADLSVLGADRMNS